MTTIVRGRSCIDSIPSSTDIWPPPSKVLLSLSGLRYCPVVTFVKSRQLNRQTYDVLAENKSRISTFGVPPCTELCHNFFLKISSFQGFIVSSDARSSAVFLQLFVAEMCFSACTCARVCFWSLAQPEQRLSHSQNIFDLSCHMVALFWVLCSRYIQHVHNPALGARREKVVNRQERLEILPDDGGGGDRRGDGAWRAGG